ncbi:hypothetical protein DH2020_020403 [Rehmannia glutinosa]|uniref:RNase H type-1 domain-containing protein n=1 Tax=Rehmannia glutinosa TaxID=99300 RepID=A0ABR0WJJ3_REHGL
MLLWTIWYARNMRTFQDKEISHNECFALALKCLHEYQAVRDDDKGAREKVRVHQWQRPKEGTVKINTDASIIKGEGSSIGVAIRTHNGEVLKVLSKRYDQEFAVDIMEAIACREGLKIATELHLECVEVETDCLIIAHAYHQRQTNLTYLGRVIDDIRELDISLLYLALHSKNSQ